MISNLKRVRELMPGVGPRVPLDVPQARGGVNVVCLIWPHRPDVLAILVDTHRVRQDVGCTRARAASHVLIVLSLTAALSSCAAAEDSRTVEPAAGHSWNQVHRVDLPAGWIVTARNVGPTDESTSLDGPDSAGCLVSVSPPEPEHYWGGSPKAVSVQGFTASYGKRDRNYGPYSAQVVWQAGDRWFGVSCDLDQKGILRLAEGVHAGTNPMLVPFRQTSVPDGVRMTQLIESVDGAATRVSAQFEQASSSRPLTMEISNLDRESIAQGPVETQTIGGRQVEVRRASQSICLSTRSEPICVSGPGDEPSSDWSPAARRVAEETAGALVPVADSSDVTSWYDADDAFPS